jgi:hypothetical protein
VTPGVRNGLIVAALHLAIVGGLAGKLLVDRATRPRVWARAAPVDPELPIRGRYLRLRIEATPAPGLDRPVPLGARVALSVEDGTLVASPDADSRLDVRIAERDGARVAVLQQPLAYFIPEHVPDPSVRGAGEELWVEVTLPRRGAPRPIRLGVRRDGVVMPLALD